MKRTLLDIRENMDHAGCDNATALEMCAEIERLRSDLIERHRTLWLIVRSNGGYTLDKHAIEEWPGERAVLATRTDPATGNLVFAAYASSDEQSVNLDDVKDMKTWPEEIRREHGIKDKP